VSFGEYERWASSQIQIINLSSIGHSGSHPRGENRENWDVVLGHGPTDAVFMRSGVPTRDFGTKVDPLNDFCTSSFILGTDKFASIRVFQLLNTNLVKMTLEFCFLLVLVGDVYNCLIGLTNSANYAILNCQVGLEFH